MYWISFSQLRQRHQSNLKTNPVTPFFPTDHHQPDETAMESWMNPANWMALRARAVKVRRVASELLQIKRLLSVEEDRYLAMVSDLAVSSSLHR